MALGTPAGSSNVVALNHGGPPDPTGQECRYSTAKRFSSCARHGAQRRDWRFQPASESEPGSDLGVKVPWGPRVPGTSS